MWDGGWRLGWRENIQKEKDDFLKKLTSLKLSMTLLKVVGDHPRASLKCSQACFHRVPLVMELCTENAIGCFAFGL